MLTILWVLIPLTFCLIIIFCWLVYFESIKKKKSMILKELEFLIKKERIIKIEALLNRVYFISNKNSKHVDLYKNLSIQHTNIEVLLKKTIDEFGLLVLNEKKMKINDFDKKSQNLKEKTKLLNGLQYDFEIAAENITQQDEFMKSEMTFYTHNLRKIIDVYNKKRFLLEYISLKLDSLLNVINQLSKSFENALDKADIIMANTILNKYSQKVIKFSKMVNEGPSIQSYLYATIPKLIKNLITIYNEKRKEVGGALGHINFKTTVSDIASKYKKAKINYSNLNFEKAKKRIEGILKSIKILERLISFEIKSRNTFVKNYSKTIELTKKSFISYINVKKQIRELISQNETNGIELVEKYNILKKTSKCLDHQAVEFENKAKLKMISFSEKLVKMKLLVQKNKMFMCLVNELIFIIWNQNSRKLLLKNRFKKAEMALQQIVYSIKKNKIVLSDEESEHLDDFSHSFSKISLSFISNNFSSEIEFEVCENIKNFAYYYEVIASKIEISKITKNIINMFSPKRGIDAELNAELIFAESFYLKGAYAEALNIIIANSEGVK